MTPQRTAITIIVISLAACEDPPRSSSTDGGSVPTAPSTAFRPPLALPGPGVTLSGRILEVAPNGTRRPISARQVQIEVDVNDVRDPNRGGWVPVDADGRYRVTGVLDGHFVKITGVDTTGFGSLYRFCGTNTTTRGDTELDVPLFLPGAAVATPTLSGQVFRMIDGKPVPVGGADVYYRSRGYRSDVIEYTDADGRYSMCGIPQMPGTLSMYCGNDIQVVNQSVDIRADHIIDIDATDFLECLLLSPKGANQRGLDLGPRNAGSGG
jgi:hypothetical protein